ncbi:hypothetical protein KC717_01025 [Candidatus Dojkabacteria bacterium]|uniref:Uncharacterized protein n=1 Tax=Candidatus Dojkabacteria bacterium TaxID=2099670 RepID=A0A955RJX8_9BACT|nr:hypothetical protein [Candidatus Dojkabacteria bacterium]
MRYNSYNKPIVDPMQSPGDTDPQLLQEIPSTRANLLIPALMPFAGIQANILNWGPLKQYIENWDTIEPVTSILQIIGLLGATAGLMWGYSRTTTKSAGILGILSRDNKFLVTDVHVDTDKLISVPSDDQILMKRKQVVYTYLPQGTTEPKPRGATYRSVTDELLAQTVDLSELGFHTGKEFEGKRRYLPLARGTTKRDRFNLSRIDRDTQGRFILWKKYIGLLLLTHLESDDASIPELGSKYSNGRWVKPEDLMEVCSIPSNTAKAEVYRKLIEEALLLQPRLYKQ